MRVCEVRGRTAGHGKRASKCVDARWHMGTSGSQRDSGGGGSTGAGRRRGDDVSQRNSVNLTKTELDVVLDQLDSGGKAEPIRRLAARLPFRLPNVGMDIIQPGGGQTHITVACRNLSRTGLGFLHSAYVHVGTACVVTLEHRVAGPVKIIGSVVRCRHVNRHIHDVGVKFNQPLNLRDYMRMDAMDGVFSTEKVDPSMVKGVLLVVAEYKIEQACIVSMLRDTSLDFVVASSVEEGLTQAVKGVDLVICDQLFEKSSGPEFIAKARDSGVRCPVIVMTADKSPEARARIRAVNADGLLLKPLQADTVLRAVAEFLVVRGEQQGEGNPLYSSLPSSSPMSELADEFVSDLRAAGDEIERLAEAKDIEGIRRRCLRISGAAANLGFEPIAKMATALLTALDATMSVEESMAPLRTLASTCRAVRKRGAAKRAG